MAFQRVYITCPLETRLEPGLEYSKSTSPLFQIQHSGRDWLLWFALKPSGKTEESAPRSGGAAEPCREPDRAIEGSSSEDDAQASQRRCLSSFLPLAIVLEVARAEREKGHLGRSRPRLQLPGKVAVGSQFAVLTESYQDV